MLDNFFIGNEETWGRQEVALPKDNMNTIDGTSDKRGTFKENGDKRRHTYLESKRDNWNY